MGPFGTRQYVEPGHLVHGTFETTVDPATIWDSDHLGPRAIWDLDHLAPMAIWDPDHLGLGPFGAWSLGIQKSGTWLN